MTCFDKPKFGGEEDVLPCNKQSNVQPQQSPKYIRNICTIRVLSSSMKKIQNNSINYSK